MCATQHSLDQILRPLVQRVSGAYLVEDLSVITTQQLDALLAAQPEWRQQRTYNIRNARARRQSVVAFALLQYALNDYCASSATNPSDAHEPTDALQHEFLYGAHGKPSLRHYPNIHFSISPCAAGVAAIVSDQPVGIDLEPLSRTLPAAIRDILPPTDSATPTDPLTLWTSCEAILKLTGEGVSSDMRDVLLNHPTIGVSTHQTALLQLAIARKIGV